MSSPRQLSIAACSHFRTAACPFDGISHESFNLLPTVGALYRSINPASAREIGSEGAFASALVLSRGLRSISSLLRYSSCSWVNLYDGLQQHPRDDQDSAMASCFGAGELGWLLVLRASPRSLREFLHRFSSSRTRTSLQYQVKEFGLLSWTLSTSGCTSPKPTSTSSRSSSGCCTLLACCELAVCNSLRARADPLLLFRMDDVEDDSHLRRGLPGAWSEQPCEQ